MQHFWVYLLRCSDGRLYAGHTDDLEKRIGQHQLGQGSDVTARRRPVTVAWSEAVPTREEALAFELRIKGWGRAKKEALIADDWARVHDLAVSRGARASTLLSTNGRLGSDTNNPFVLSESFSERSRIIEGRAASDRPGNFAPSRQDGR